MAAVSRLFDILLIWTAFLYAFYLRKMPLFGLDPLYLDERIIFLYYRLLIITVIAHILISQTLNYYLSLRFYTYPQLIAKTSKIIFINFLVVTLALFILRDLVISRFFTGIFYALYFCILLAEKLLLKVFTRRLTSLATSPRHILIIGCNDRSLVITGEIYKHLEWGYTISGYLYFAEDRISPNMDRSRILGNVKDLEKILEDHVIDEVIFVANRDYIFEIDKYITICETQGKTIRIYLDIFEGSYVSKFRPELFGHIPVFTFHTISLGYMQNIMKRLIDIAGGIPGLLIFILFYFIFAPIIKLTSRGPVLFRQRRIGMNNREIYIFKFRTMYEDAEKRKQELMAQNELKGAVFKMKNDPRITPIGGFLRQYSIDEFPQFINVLAGDMSLVGTRPPTPDEVEKYDQWHRRRISIKPGITGLWQVSGRNAVTNFDDIVRLDLEYVDNWTIWLDIKIILKTVVEVFRRRGF